MRHTQHRKKGCAFILPFENIKCQNNISIIYLFFDFVYTCSKFLEKFKANFTKAQQFLFEFRQFSQKLTISSIIFSFLVIE